MTGPQQPQQPERLAVYGTLVPGGSNAHVLADVSGGWARGTVDGTRHEDGWHGYPGLVLDTGDRTPVRVLHSPVLDDHLGRLDAFEGPGYRRVITTAVLDDGSEVAAWVYELAEPPG